MTPWSDAHGHGYSAEVSRTQVTVHVRGANRAEVLAQVDRRMRRRGLELVRDPRPSEPLLVRARLVEHEPWVSLAIEELDTPDEWARFLARELGLPTLGAWFWDGEASLELTLFEPEARVAKLSLPSDARRAGDGRVVIPLGKLSRLVPRAKPKTTGLDLLVRAEEASFDEDDRCVYLPEEVGLAAVSRAFGIDELFIDPFDDDASDRVLHFRPKPSSAIAKRARAEDEAEARTRRADHDGRVYTVGWLAFDASPRDVEGVLKATARTVVAMLTPHLGSRVLLARAVTVGRGETPLPPPSEGDRAWKHYARALGDGAFVDLGRRDAPPLAAVWLVMRDGALVVGWCMRGLKDPVKRGQLAAAMDAVLSSSSNDARCFGALITCQRSPMSLERQALAYEYLRGTSAFALRPDAHRAVARAPGWRVLVPAAARIEGPVPRGFSMRAARAGIVLQAASSDPHEMPPGEMDALEGYLETNAAIARPVDTRSPSNIVPA
jgi:hypothetical protein